MNIRFHTSILKRELKKVGPFKAVVSLKSEGGRQNFRFNWSPNIHENNE